MQEHKKSTARYVNSFAFKDTVLNVKKYIQAEQYSRTNRWGYLDDQVTELNHWTKENGSGENCYNHRWVFTISDCQPTDIIASNSTANNFRLNTGNVICVALSWENGPGDYEIIDYSGMMNNYASDTAACGTAVNEIDRIAVLITNALQTKFDSLQDTYTAIDE